VNCWQEKFLTGVRIILVEPAGALNVGAVARVMKNMGLEQLVLVNPHCNPSSEETRRMAVHAVDLLDKVQLVSSLAEALAGCHRAIATTGRSRALPTPLETPRTALPWLLGDNLTSALIFGPEDRGLSNTELNYAQRFVCIPAHPAYPSLNLAQAVAVCAYELYQATQVGVAPPESTAHLAPLDALEGYYGHLETLLLKIGYLYPHTAPARMEKFRRLYNRAHLTEEEVALLRGILRQMDWVWQHLPDSNSQENMSKEG
jgi:tRNA/rRNA methyltransferase